MNDYYDRYSKLRANGTIRLMPNVRIDEAGSDLNIAYDRNKMRFDMLSYKYYGDPNYAWLILLANGKYGSLEFNIPDGAILRIPYPLNSALSRFENSIREFY